MEAPILAPSGLQFSPRPARIRPSLPRTPEQQQIARERYMQSAHFHARVLIEKERIRERQAERQRNRNQFEADRDARRAARLGANEPETAAERAFASRSYNDFGKDKAKITAELTTTAAVFQATAPHIWESSEPGRMLTAAFVTLGNYQEGKVTNGQLDGALKDLVYANPVTAENVRTGEIAPQRHQAANNWKAAVEQAAKLIDVVRTTDRERNAAAPERETAGPSR